MYENEKATLPRVAETNTEQKTSYRNGDNQSSHLKEKIGEILICLFAGNAQPETWQHFDRLMRQLYEGGVM